MENIVTKKESGFFISYHFVYLVIIICLSTYIIWQGGKGTKVIEDPETKAKLLKIQSERDSILKVQGDLFLKIKEADLVIEKKDLEIKNGKARISSIESRLKNMNSQLLESQQRIEKTKEAIKNLETNIPLKEGEELIVSLKQKFRK